MKAKQISKIGFDARMIEHSGIGVRILNLLNKLHLFKPDSFEIVLLGNKEILEKYNLHKFYKIEEYNPEVYSIREILGASILKKFDYLDIPHFNIPILYIKKTIVTIHDIIPWKMKEFFPEQKKRIYLRFIFFLIKFFSKKVISVSEFTKKDLIEEFNFKENQIQTIYNGINQELFRKKTSREIESFKKKYNLPKDFFLTVGIGKEHKNISFLIECLKTKWTSQKNFPKLVIAGSSGIIPDYLKKVVSGFEEKIIFLEKISFEELPCLYASAKLYLYPSLYEGFGFPGLEAQSMECPVLSSNKTVLPEILGNSAFYFDPTNKEDFLLKLEETLIFLKTEKKFLETGKKNADKFTWEKAAEKIILNYTDLTKNLSI